MEQGAAVCLRCDIEDYDSFRRTSGLTVCGPVVTDKRGLQWHLQVKRQGRAAPSSSRKFLANFMLVDTTSEVESAEDTDDDDDDTVHEMLLTIDVKGAAPDSILRTQVHAILPLASSTAASVFPTANVAGNVTQPQLEGVELTQASTFYLFSDDSRDNCKLTLCLTPQLRQQLLRGTGEHKTLSIVVYMVVGSDLSQKPLELPMQLAWTRDPRRYMGLTGLLNQGATCYLNSLLQSLFHTPLFRKLVYECPVLWSMKHDIVLVEDAAEGHDVVDMCSEADLSINKERNNGRNVPALTWPIPDASFPIDGAPDDRCRVVAALQTMFLDMECGKTKAVGTTALTQSFGWTSSERYVQHDVQELLRVLLDRVEATLAGTPLQHCIKFLFQGRTVTWIDAPSIGYRGKQNFETFSDVQVPVAECSTLQEAIRKLTAPENLTGDNQYEAAGHAEKVDAIRTTKFAHLPPILHIQLNRFDIDSFGNRRKINSALKFPETLDLTEFMAGDSVVDSSEELPPAATQGSMPASAATIAQMCGDIAGQFASQSPVYRLHSVLVHSGTASSGHYYAFVRPSIPDQAPVAAAETVGQTWMLKPLDGRGDALPQLVSFHTEDAGLDHSQAAWDGWFKLDDTTVTPVQANEAIDSNFGGGVGSSSAYFLVYMREQVIPQLCCTPSSAAFSKEACQHCEMLSMDAAGQPMWSPPLEAVAKWQQVSACLKVSPPASTDEVEIVETVASASPAECVSPYFRMCHLPVPAPVIRRSRAVENQTRRQKMNEQKAADVARRNGSVMFHLCTNAHLVLQQQFGRMIESIDDRDFDFDVFRPEHAFRWKVPLRTLCAMIPSLLADVFGVPQSTFRLWRCSRVHSHSSLRISGHWSTDDTEQNLDDVLWPDANSRFKQCRASKRSFSSFSMRATKPSSARQQAECTYNSLLVDPWQAAEGESWSFMKLMEDARVVSPCLGGDFEMSDPDIQYHAFLFVELLSFPSKRNLNLGERLWGQLQQCWSLVEANSLAWQQVLFCNTLTGGKRFKSNDAIIQACQASYDSLREGHFSSDLSAFLDTCLPNLKGARTDGPGWQVVPIQIVVDSSIKQAIGKSAVPNYFPKFVAARTYWQNDRPEVIGTVVVPALCTISELKYMLAQWLGICPLQVPSIDAASRMPASALVRDGSLSQSQEAGAQLCIYEVLQDNYLRATFDANVIDVGSPSSILGLLPMGSVFYVKLVEPELDGSSSVNMPMTTFTYPTLTDFRIIVSFADVTFDDRNGVVGARFMSSKAGEQSKQVWTRLAGVVQHLSLDHLVLVASSVSHTNEDMLAKVLVEASSYLSDLNLVLEWMQCGLPDISLPSFFLPLQLAFPSDVSIQRIQQAIVHQLAQRVQRYAHGCVSQFLQQDSGLALGKKRRLRRVGGGNAPKRARGVESSIRDDDSTEEEEVSSSIVQFPDFLEMVRSSHSFTTLDATEGLLQGMEEHINIYTIGDFSGNDLKLAPSMSTLYAGGGVSCSAGNPKDRPFVWEHLTASFRLSVLVADATNDPPLYVQCFWPGLPRSWPDWLYSADWQAALLVQQSVMLTIGGSATMHSIRQQLAESLFKLPPGGGKVQSLEWPRLILGIYACFLGSPGQEGDGLCVPVAMLSDNSECDVHRALQQADALIKDPSTELANTMKRHGIPMDKASVRRLVVVAEIDHEWLLHKMVAGPDGEVGGAPETSGLLSLADSIFVSMGVTRLHKPTMSQSIKNFFSKPALAGTATLPVPELRFGRVLPISRRSGKIAGTLSYANELLAPSAEAAGLSTACFDGDISSMQWEDEAFSSSPTYAIHMTSGSRIAPDADTVEVVGTPTRPPMREPGPAGVVQLFPSNGTKWCAFASVLDFRGNPCAVPLAVLETPEYASFGAQLRSICGGMLSSTGMHEQGLLLSVDEVLRQNVSVETAAGSTTDDEAIVIDDEVAVVTRKSSRSASSSLFRKETGVVIR